MTSTHNVKAYRNNMEQSAAKAPYLGKYVPNETLPFEALCEQVASHSGQTAIQVRAILEGSFDAIAELERDGLAIVHLDGLSVFAVIKGSFPTGDAEFDPARNALVLAIRLEDGVRLALANVTPRMVTDDDLPKVRIGNVKDLEVERPTNLIHGRHVFRVAGHKLILSDAGARVYLKGKDGAEIAVTVDDVHSDQLFTAHVPELLEGGDYTLWVESRAGVEDGPLQRDRCRLKYLRVEDPTPSLTVTGVHNEETEPPAIYVGRSLLFDGTGLDAWGDGDRIEVKRLGDGETDWESITGTDDVTVTPSDGMLWVSTDWWSAISFGVEDGIQIRFRVTIGGTSVEVNGTVHEE